MGSFVQEGAQQCVVSKTESYHFDLFPTPKVLQLLEEAPVLCRWVDRSLGSFPEVLETVTKNSSF